MIRFRTLAFFVLLITLTAGSFFGAETAPLIDRAVTFAAIGDSGSGDEDQMAVARRLTEYHRKRSYDFVIMLGDNIYETGREKYIKSHFEDPYRELLADGIKFYAILGNHDIVKGLEFQTNYPNFNMGGRRYYNYVKGDGLIEFFALDSNEMTDEQLAWLEESLKKSTARWKVAYTHHPLYSSARMHGAYIKLRNQLEPLYVKYGVNVSFSGHSHCYERIKPQKGIQYFVEGASGKIKRKTIDFKSPLLEVGNDNMHSFMIMNVTENEFRTETRGADDSLIDNHVIRHPSEAASHGN